MANDFGLSSLLSDPWQIVRTAVVPMGNSLIESAITKFLDTADSDDWRVRLSIPSTTFLASSAVFSPLREAGGLVFPYTPTISFGGTAQYEPVSVTHQNFSFMTYQNSTPGDITITAPFYVEDNDQAVYWIAVVHFLRSVTKMFTGNDDGAGSPPPILTFNAYGDFVFKNVPVVVKNYTITLGNDCDYISAEPSTGIDLSDYKNAVGVLSNTVPGGISAAISSMWGDRKAKVPTKSDITVILGPIYSREVARRFSLANFVNGSYIAGGYI